MSLLPRRTMRSSSLRPARTLVPMSLVDRAVGVLALWSADRAFSRADEELLTTVAALTAARLAR